MNRATTILSLAVPALLASCSATPRQAAGLDGDSARGAYVKAFVGTGILQDEDILFDDGAGGGADGEGSFDAGIMGGVAAGYRFDDRWALELEYAYRSNDVDEFTSGGSPAATGGDYASTALMLNGFYHFDTDWALNPYVGLGFGLATEVDIDLDGLGGGGGRSFSTESPAAQFMVGAAGELGSNLGYFVEGRFFRAFDPDMSGEDNPGNVESEYGHLGLMVGLSYGF